MKTLDELAAIERQNRARWAYLASRCHIADSRMHTAVTTQLEAAHNYRMARAWMGITKGDVKNAERC